MIAPFAAGGVGLDLGTGPLTFLVIGVLLALSFFFSGTETAYFSLQKVDRERFADAGPTGRQIVWLLSRRAALITTILLGNESVNIAVAATTASLVAHWFPTMPWLNVVLLTPVLVLVSEITPKAIAYRFRQGWAQLAAWPLTAVYTLVAPFRIVFAAIVGAIGRLLGAGAETHDGVAEEELMVLVDDGAASGQLDPLERDIIEAVFEFDELTVDRLMTPRPDVASISLNTGWSELLAFAREQELSRLPVTGVAPDDIVGVLLVKDLLKFREAPLSGPRQLRALLLPPVFVPASKSADSMLREFLERRFHMAFVVDEHGTFVGLVTLDDLLGELLGAIDDEASEDSEIARIRPDALTVKASIDLEDFGEETGIVLPEGEYHTLGGYVFHELGRLPRKGDAVTFGPHTFQVSKMEGRRIAELVVSTAPAPGEPPAPDQEAV